MTDLKAPTLESRKAATTVGGRRAPLVLAPFQRRAVEALATEIAITHSHIARAIHSRREIARGRGTCLLVAPTGSGKTLMMGRTLETLVPDPIVPAAGFKGAVWFWFAPYSGLIDQTRSMLRRDCNKLRPRDLHTDREPSITRDGDVFVHTWGAVAANNREARRLRRSGERALSVDDFIEELRERGFFIGAVIDEAHINFGMTARAAASFYLDHLRPDTTILATATPRDAKLDAFEAAAGIKTFTRVEVSRAEVVLARLNKRGLVAAHLALTDEQRLAIDPDEAILRAAWLHHTKIKQRLRECGIALIPLLLVQVPDATRGEPDPVSRAKDSLINGCGVDANLISVHTSGQPDPAFHALANDDAVEVLIFKLSAATGFDAPRAWCLVSLRPSLSPEFGLQVVGRIMRVHPLVRLLPGQDTLLDRGYVFLVDRDRQAGLESAASRLKALRSTIEPVTDQISILGIGYETDSRQDNSPYSGGTCATLSGFVGEASSGSIDTVGELIADGVGDLLEKSAAGDQPTLPGFEFFGAPAAATAKSVRRGNTIYSLRRDLGIPQSLHRERMPDSLPLLAEEAAREFAIDDSVVALLMRPGIDVELKLRELLLSEQERSERFAARPSPAKLAEAAQLVFAFNEDIDPRYFRRHLVDRFRQAIVDQGGNAPRDSELRRAIDQIAVYQPQRIREAMRRALSRHVLVVQADPIPSMIEDEDGLFEARRAAFGVFPSKLNGPERRFAELIDEISDVRWWLRNPDHPQCSWSVKIILADGKGFFPDFIVGVAGRRTPDNVRLVEVKDTGETGRLQADLNLVKIRTRHRAYLDVLWVTEDGNESGHFSRMEYSPERNRIVALGPITAAELRGD